MAPTQENLAEHRGQTVAGVDTADIVVAIAWTVSILESLTGTTGEAPIDWRRPSVKFGFLAIGILLFFFSICPLQDLDNLKTSACLLNPYSKIERLEPSRLRTKTDTKRFTLAWFARKPGHFFLERGGTKKRATGEANLSGRCNKRQLKMPTSRCCCTGWIVGLGLCSWWTGNIVRKFWFRYSGALNYFYVMSFNWCSKTKEAVHYWKWFRGSN